MNLNSKYTTKLITNPWEKDEFGLNKVFRKWYEYFFNLIKFYDINKMVRYREKNWLKNMMHNCIK